MKFVVDESTGQSVAHELRRLGHDVLAIRESYPAIDDPPILKIAVNEDRIIVTNDKDFGELVYRSGLPHAGIVLFRLKDERAENRIRMLKIALQKCSHKFKNNFTVVTERKIRIRTT